MAQVVAEGIGNVKLETVKNAVDIKVAQVFGSSHILAMDNIIQNESGFNPYAKNPISGACGIFQSINCVYKLGDVDGQILWGINYIKTRYSNPSRAWSFWQLYHWY